MRNHMTGYQKPLDENDYYFTLTGNHTQLYNTADDIPCDDGMQANSYFSMDRQKSNYDVRGLYDDYIPDAYCFDFTQKMHMGLSLINDTPYYSNTHYNKGSDRCESSYGCVHTDLECLELISRARQGKIAAVPGRLNEKEKSMIRPGSIFVYSEGSSGILRWTDKKDWTPSRVQGAFLVYKELKGGLCKKTYTLRHSDQVWRLVAYTLLEWEEKGTCCEFFKGHNKEMNQRFMDSEHVIIDLIGNQAAMESVRIGKRQAKEKRSKLPKRVRTHSEDMALSKIVCETTKK